MASEKPYLAVTCTAPVNIAVIKYWGKRDEELILPINSSLSVTLHQDQLKTTTTAVISKDFTEDRIWLNGREEDIGQPRIQACLREIRRLARKRRSDDEEDPLPLSLNYKVHVASVNNFPTAAGLASSASGYACLAYALARVYGVESDLSEVARRGSGSACRSLYGGFVEWQMGELADGKDSVARQVAPESHWPELRVLILVFRAEAVVPARMAEMIRYVKERNFQGFGELTMKDSNQFHATCLDTFPPISYLNDTSRRIIHLVHRFNAHHGQTKVAYTFDAGPNAVIFTLDDTVAEFVAAVRHSFPPESNGDKFLKGLPVKPGPLSDELKAALGMDPTPGGIKYIIATQVGPGLKSWTTHTLTSWARTAYRSQQFDRLLERSPGHHLEKGLLCWDWGAGCGSSCAMLVGTGGWLPGPGLVSVPWPSGGSEVTTCRLPGGQEQAPRQVPHLPGLYCAEMRAGMGCGTWWIQPIGLSCWCVPREVSLTLSSGATFTRRNGSCFTEMTGSWHPSLELEDWSLFRKQLLQAQDPSTKCFEHDSHPSSSARAQSAGCG
ncbi:diphosphomevalonate decarboxylase isoform X2 [Myotis lucifugus]|uniref:diphosphomevalonate decarboxylase isoform X2 n=1 Tax=Myotis lucifugus TaxID=59463 RepID=UPI000CCC972D|nr:diphosphomevalonate decarboxylase isoform X2 [Myotis lucifugus]